MTWALALIFITFAATAVLAIVVVTMQVRARRPQEGVRQWIKESADEWNHNDKDVSVELLDLDDVMREQNSSAAAPPSSLPAPASPVILKTPHFEAPQQQFSLEERGAVFPDDAPGDEPDSAASSEEMLSRDELLDTVMAGARTEAPAEQLPAYMPTEQRKRPLSGNAQTVSHADEASQEAMVMPDKPPLERIFDEIDPGEGNER